MFKQIIIRMSIGFILTILSACSGKPSSISTQASTSSVQSTAPQFSHPAEINNPFFPISSTAQTISIGTEDGKSTRNEVTLLPDIKTIIWDGRKIQTRVVQFVSYSDGNLTEIAYDYFAQADDGSVYYLGEEVSNYADGQMIDTEGSWQAGQDGAPPALIMPAKPEVGQIFNPENLPGKVFETDEIISTEEKVITPGGPINNGVKVKETLMDGSIEHKIYAANYGIVVDESGGEQVSLVLWNQVDAKPGTVPDPVLMIEAQAEDLIDIVPEGNWVMMANDVDAIQMAWQSYQSTAEHDHVPQVFLDELSAAIDQLQISATAHNQNGTIRAANNLSAAVVDLYDMYHPITPPDLGRLDVLDRQVIQDIASNNITAAADDLAKISAVWARLKPVILANNGAATAAMFDASLATQQEDFSNKDFSMLATEANNALSLVDDLESLF